ncbi:MAG: BLUF domain-containing protein [Pseudomonadota bacterium]
MRLHTVTYYSRLSGCADVDFNDILATARRNNARDNITGCLFTNGVHFVQTLEGGRSAVATCLQRIMRDDRHDDIVIVQAGDIDMRFFPDWSMGAVTAPETRIDEIRRFASDGAYRPEIMSSKAVVESLRSLALYCAADALSP